MRDFIIIFAAMTCIVLGDSAGKALAATGISPLFIAWARFALGAALLAPVAGLTRRDWSALWDWRLLLRTLLIVGGISAILTALKTEPIANVFGGFFVGPVVAYAASAILLGEKTSRARTALLLLSFAGVLLVVKPGFGMRPGMGFALLAGTFYGAYLVATRWLAGAFRPRFLLFSQLFLGALVLAPFGLSMLPNALDWPKILLIVASAMGSALGNYILVIASRRLSAGVIAPLVYTQLIAATALGWLFFDDLPDIWAALGLLIILASGLWGLLLAQKPAKSPTTPTTQQPNP